MSNDNEKYPNVVVYTLTVTVSRPIRVYDSSDTVEEVIDWMTSSKAERELEKEVLRALRNVDGDSDAEVTDAQVEKGPSNDE